MKILIHTISYDNFTSAAAVAVTDAVPAGGRRQRCGRVGRGITFDVSIIPALALTKSC